MPERERVWLDITFKKLSWGLSVNDTLTTFNLADKEILLYMINNSKKEQGSRDLIKVHANIYGYYFEVVNNRDGTADIVKASLSYSFNEPKIEKEKPLIRVRDKRPKKPKRPKEDKKAYRRTVEEDEDLPPYIRVKT